MTTKKPKAGTSKQAAEDRKAIFVEAYIANGGNATDAAKTAGYSAKTADQQGSRLLKDVKVQQILSERQKTLAKKYELTTEAVIAELAKIVHVDPRKMLDANGELLPISEWPDEVAAAVASVEVFEEYDGTGKDRTFIGLTKKIKFWDKNSAIEKAMKHLGLFEKDNSQKRPLGDMSDAALDKFIERRAAEAGITFH